MKILFLLLLTAALYAPAKAVDSPHGPGFKISCKTCHSSKGWQLDKDVYSFDHNSTKMKLVGQHKQINCRQCHPTLVFKEAKTECYQCHNDVHQSTVGSDCSRCHTPASWLVNNINEIHQMSRFPLLGVHRTADCSQCHKSETLTRFDVPGINCVDCHRQNYLATTNPNHVQSGISEDCLSCHLTSSFQWAGAGFDHKVFPLVQGHSTPKCADCHVTSKYSDAKPDCYSCHQQDYLVSKEPDHTASAFSQTCTDCHTLNPGWKPTTFDHSKFPLTLGHAVPKCADCHIGGNYTTTPVDCYACHQQDFTVSKEPDHVASQFAITCTDCHTTNPGWKPTTLDHSKFPLTSGHSTPKCSDCHIGGNYTTTPIDCYACHQQNYLATTNPNHTGAGFAQTCKDCHTTNPGWTPTTFVHTIFPLTLGHSTPKCSDCHISGNYTTTSSDCYSCHQKDFLSTTEPNHSISGFPQTCKDCHTTNPGWKPTSFNHNMFPLTLGHSVPKCSDCHIAGNFTTTPIDCYACHQQDYLATTDPNHKTSAFSITCTDCHTNNPGWKPTTFNHTAFPLTLGHATPKCSDCHIGGNYSTTSPDCYSCHQQDFLSTTDPNHTTSGFAHTCKDCHSTSPGWKPATFSHTSFPLTLGHAGPSCNDCHKGNYTTTSTDCYACHQANFNATVNPNHRTLSFSITCTQCHTTNPDWKPAKFLAHDTQFPIYSGKHQGEWSSCTDCHKNVTNYALFSCIDCHEHNKTDMDREHVGEVSGYSWVSTECLRCHPRGNSD
jgi:hypothetical protein